MKTYEPQVMIDQNARPLIVFAKGRILFHAIAARETDIAIVTLESLRGLRALERRAGEPYPPRKAASFWLNHSSRPISKRARQVLVGLVARRKEGA